MSAFAKANLINKSKTDFLWCITWQRPKPYQSMHLLVDQLSHHLQIEIQLKVMYFLYFNVTKFCDIKNRSKYPQNLPRSTCLHCKKKCILWVYVSEMSLVLLTFSFRNCSFTFWSCFLRLAFSCCRFSTCQRGKKQTLLYVPNVILYLISLVSLSVWFVTIA